MSTPAAILADLVRLQRETKALRDRLTRDREERRRLAVARIVDRAYLDALALVTVSVGGGAVGREYSPLPARRWRYAVALLELAGKVRSDDAGNVLALWKRRGKRAFDADAEGSEA